MFHSLLFGLVQRSIADPTRLIATLSKRQDGAPNDVGAGEMDQWLKDAIDTVLDDFWWWFAILIINLIIFVPVCIYLSYSVSNLWPVLAIIEDDAPPSYERIALGDNEEGEKDDDVESDQQRPVTSSIREMNAMLYRIGGWPSLLRGLRPHMILGFCILIVGGILSSIPFLPSFVAISIAPLATVQLYTGWIHIAISQPSSEPFWRRLPKFSTAFRATALPTFIVWVALAISQVAPLSTMKLMGFDMYDPTGTDMVSVPYVEGTANDLWGLLAVAAAYLVPTVFLLIPAHMVLTRVQASLLPADEQSIVSFDRSFRLARGEKDGTEAEYISVIDAWRSFSKAAWIRLIKLYVKTFGITVAVEAVLVSLLVFDAILLMTSMSNRND